MDEWTRGVFLREIELQSKLAIMAYNEMVRTREAIRVGSESTDNVFSTTSERYWYAAYGFLSFVANISKLLWPSRPHAGAVRLPGNRGAELRRHLSIANDSPLQNRSIRNHFEHIDERIETWAATSPTQNMVDISFFDPGTIRGISEQDYFRNVGMQAHIITWQGETFDVDEVISHIEDLHERVSGKKLTRIPTRRLVEQSLMSDTPELDE